MKKRRRLVLVAVFLFGISSLALVGSHVLPISAGQKERVFALPELEAPRQIVVEKGKVFIVDKRDVVVYDLEEGRFLKKIGKRGQGPGEFTMRPLGLSIWGDRLVVEDFRSFEYFSLDGVHLGEIKEPEDMGYYPLLSVGRNYVGFPMARNSDGSYAAPSGRIYGADFKPLKGFYGDFPAGPPPPPPPGSAEMAKQSEALLIRDYAEFVVFADRIYIADSRKGFSIAVFDQEGAFLREIKVPIEKIKVPKSFVDDIVKEWKASKYWEMIFSHKIPVVPEHFPALISLKVDGGKIYAVTPAKKDGLYEVIVMDLEGKILGREFRFPLKPNFEFASNNGFNYDIEGDKIIWFAYNDTKEIYELHIR